MTLAGGMCRVGPSDIGGCRRVPIGPSARNTLRGAGAPRASNKTLHRLRASGADAVVSAQSAETTRPAPRGAGRGVPRFQQNLPAQYPGFWVSNGLDDSWSAEIGNRIRYGSADLFT